MWGYPVPVLGAISPFLEPFRGRLSPNIDNVSEKMTLRYPHEGPWVVTNPSRFVPRFDSNRQGSVPQKPVIRQQSPRVGRLENSRPPDRMVSATARAVVQALSLPPPSPPVSVPCSLPLSRSLRLSVSPPPLPPCPPLSRWLSLRGAGKDLRHAFIISQNTSSLQSMF